MLKDELNTQKSNTTPGSFTKTAPNQIDQQQKDRTLFCINIDQKCSEDILYELFLQVIILFLFLQLKNFLILIQQAGPIDNIVRKADRNGNLICLITYKHVESCDYAIKLFNGISLFNQSLKVRPSDSNSTVSRDTNQLQRTNSTNSYQRAAYNNRQTDVPKTPTTPQSLMPPPQQLAHLQNLIAQTFSQTTFSPQIQEFGTANAFQQQLNRSWSGSNMNENDYNQQNRRNSNNFEFNRTNRRNDFNNRNNGNNNYGNDYNNSRDYSNSKQDSRSRGRNDQDEQSRSRSPIRKRNRRQMLFAC